MSLVKYRDPETGEWLPLSVAIGATYTPNVSEEGDLSWINDRGLINPLPVNIKGPKGDKGEKGEKGDPGDTPELAEWVLAPEKPEYTAEEVGALSMDATASLLEDYTTKNYVSQQITDALSKNFLIQIVTWEADD